jgi:hypothetical protein
MTVLREREEDRCVGEPFGVGDSLLEGLLPVEGLADFYVEHIQNTVPERAMYIRTQVVYLSLKAGFWVRASKSTVLRGYRRCRGGCIVG